MIEKLKGEPVMVQGVIQAAVALGLAFGIGLTATQVGTILAFTAAALGLWTRSVVAPVHLIEKRLDAGVSVLGDQDPPKGI